MRKKLVKSQGKRRERVPTATSSFGSLSPAKSQAQQFTKVEPKGGKGFPALACRHQSKSHLDDINGVNEADRNNCSCTSHPNLSHQTRGTYGRGCHGRVRCRDAHLGDCAGKKERVFFSLAIA
jgi:hypothetical protein